MIRPFKSNAAPTTAAADDAASSGARPGASTAELGGRLAGKTLLAQVITLAIWPLLEQVLNLLVGVVDLALAGHLQGEAASVAGTDALTTAMYFIWLMGIVLGSVGTGATALVARAVGAKHLRLANRVVGQAILLCLLLGVLLTGMMLAAAPWVVHVVDLSPLGQTYAYQYLVMLALIAPAQAVMMVGGACLRGAGDTRTPFVVIVIVNATNLATSLLFVLGPAPIGGHEVAGIAAGTAVAWIVGAVMTLIALARGSEGMRLRYRRMRPHVHTIRRILRIGVPNLLEVVGGTWMASFLVLIMVGQLEGEGLVGAHGIAIRIEALSFQPGFALGLAAATLCGQYLGLGDPQRARRAVILCWRMAVTTMTLTGLVFVVMPATLVGLFTDAPSVIEAATTPLRICGVIQAFFATYLVMALALRGAGDTRMTMWLTFTSVFLIRVPLSYLFGIVLDYGLNGIWIALCLDLTMRGLLFGARFLHGGWSRIEV